MRKAIELTRGMRRRVESPSNGPVWSCNEWDPLREVIVGSVRGAADIAYEPALSPYFPDGGGRDFAGALIPDVLIDEAERQLDAFAELLERRGVVVRRPEPVDHRVAVATPDWEVPFGRANACPRDVLLVVGDEIIEAPMTQRARYFEYRAYRRLINDYFRAGARWTAAPKPLMRDDLYDEAIRESTAPLDLAARPFLTDAEPAFDAASFARFGRDIFWQPDLVSNRAGADWLARHLGPAYRIHEVRFDAELPSHIDTTLVPIRPGIVLVNPSRPALGDALAAFERDGWRIVDAPPSVRSSRSAVTSSWISMNILMLDERTAVVEERERPMIDLLRSLGCDVIPCAFDRVYPFGGSFHCCTTDVRRDGVMASYFPSLD